MWAGWCFANWTTDSLPRPAVPVVFISDVGTLPLEQNQGGLRTACDKDDFPSETGDVGCGVELNGCHGGWLMAFASCLPDAVLM